jgi:hypothetical protein
VEVVTATARSVLSAVQRRLDREPERVLPTLRLLADPTAVAEPGDEGTASLAVRLNADRVADRLRRVRTHSLPTADVRKLLGGVSRQAVSLRAAANRLLAIDISGHSYFPDWQFGPQGVVPGVPDTVTALAERGLRGLAADALMRTPLPEEDGRTPADLLAAGDLGRTLHYVSALGGGF